VEIGRSFFLKRRQKLCLDLLIKKKRIAQLINKKPSKNHYNKNTSQHTNRQCKTAPNLKQPQTLDSSSHRKGKSHCSLINKYHEDENPKK
jgi:hypothetical protein